MMATTSTQSSKTQVRHRKLELGWAKSVYEGWPPRTQVSKPKFATQNSNLSWKNLYMRVNHPNPSFQTQFRHPRFEFGLAKSVYEGWPPNLSFRTQGCHPKLENGLIKSVYESWLPHTQVFKHKFATKNSNMGWLNPYHPKHNLTIPSSPHQTRIWVC